MTEHSDIPVLTRRSDENALKKTALRSLEKDALAADLYSLITGAPTDVRLLLV